LPEDESTRLFINIGRNRRIFPREILGLIGAKTSVSKDDIGTITILNNYSFVQVRNSVAAELVETLNGLSFRGRTLAVNYAKARKGEDEDPSALPGALPEALPAALESARPLAEPAQDAGYSGSDAIDEGAYDYDDADGGDDPVEADAFRDADIALDTDASVEADISGDADVSGGTSAG
jgi:hypothetical protein